MEKTFALNTIADIEMAIKLKIPIFDLQGNEIDRRILTHGYGPRFRKDEDHSVLRERFLLNMLYEDFYTKSPISLEQ